MTPPRPASKPAPISCPLMGRAEVAELEDALDSKSSGAWPRAGSTSAFGIMVMLAQDSVIVHKDE